MIIDSILDRREGEMEFVTVYFNGVLDCGAYIYGAEISLPENYTMNQLVKAMKENGYKAFMLETMRRLYYIPQN